MRYLNTVYIRDHRARVKHRGGALLVSTSDGNQRIPLEAVDALVLLGSAQVTTQALDACIRRGVRVSAGFAPRPSLSVLQSWDGR